MNSSNSIVFVLVLFCFSIVSISGHTHRPPIHHHSILQTPNTSRITKNKAFSLEASLARPYLSKVGSSPPYNSILQIRGGEMSGQDNQKPSSFSLRGSILKNLIGLWGVVQVVSVLANAIKRLLPLALQPFQTPTSLTPAQWVIYGVWSIYMMYAEGYKAFQCKFSPYVVQRAFSILDHAHKGDNATNAITTIINVLLAGPYSMGLFNASRKRMIVAWGVGIGVYALVRGVKYLPYPYRSIVDGGVVLGLTWGSLSILFLTIKALLGGKVEAKED